MRELLELLGLAGSSAHREPIALPPWTRWVIPAAVAALTLLSVLLFQLVRFLAG
jgi:hypothetical protein